MNEQESVEMQISSAIFYHKEADNLLKEYHECRTLHGKDLLIPRLKELYSKLHLEHKTLKLILDNHDETTDF